MTSNHNPPNSNPNPYPNRNLEAGRVEHVELGPVGAEPAARHRLERGRERAERQHDEHVEHEHEEERHAGWGLGLCGHGHRGTG